MLIIDICQDLWKKFQLHPQRKRIISIIIGLFILIVLILIIARCSEKPAETAGQPVNVIPAKPENYALTISGTGNISSRYLPKIKSLDNSTVKTVSVRIGENVKQNQELLQLDKTPLETAVKQAMTNNKAAIAEYDTANQAYKMNEKLVKDGTVSKLAYLQAKTQMHVAAEKVKNSENALADAKYKLKQTTIRSPINGKIADINVSSGSKVNIGDELITIVNNHRVTAAFPYAYSKMPDFKLGQRVVLTGHNSSQTINAKVSRIDPDVDKDSGLFNVLVSFYNRYNWSVGSNVKGVFTLQRVPNTLVLPDTAVITKDRRFVIYTVKDNKATEIPVKVIKRGKNQIAVLANVAAGANIVTYGAGYLNNGSKVSIQKESLQ